jgi:hypothetical protein
MFTAAAVLAGLLAVVFASAGVDKFRGPGVRSTPP